MDITDNVTIREIQEAFSDKFPFLKLEFYSERHEAGEGSPDKVKLDPDQTIGDARTIDTEGDISINGHLKVSTLEHTFYEKYGLNVQVFRRSGDIWLQTISTDDWTLTEQNERGAKSVR